jgi:hypothetical protein
MPVKNVELGTHIIGVESVNHRMSEHGRFRFHNLRRASATALRLCQARQQESNPERVGGKP